MKVLQSRKYNSLSTFAEAEMELNLGLKYIFVAFIAEVPNVI